MSSFAANGLAMLVARLLVPACSLAINVAIARLYGSPVLGAYVQLVSLALIFQTAAGAGLVPLLSRDIAADPAGAVRKLRTARTLVFLTGAASTVAMAGAGLYLSAPGNRGAVLLLAFSVLPSGWISIQEASFIAFRKHSRITLVAASENVLKVALAAAVFAAGGGLTLLCAGVAVSRLWALWVGNQMMRRAGMEGAWTPIRSGLGAFAQEAAPFAILLTLSILYFRVDVIILGAIRGADATGVYGAALALYSAVLLLPESAMSAAYPRLASAFRDSRHSYSDASLATARLLVSFIMPIAIVLIAVAEPLLRFVYGGRFASAAPTLRLLAMSLPLHAANGAIGQALQAAHLQKQSLFVVLVGVAVHIALNVWLISRVGINGAPIALLLSSSVVLAGTLVVFHRRIARLDFDPRTLAWLTCSGVSIAIAILTPGPYRALSGLLALAWLGLSTPFTVRRADLALVSRAFKTAQAVAAP